MPRSSGPLSKFLLDERADAPPFSEQIIAALAAGASKVLDLFRSWDADGDGRVTRREFHKALRALAAERSERQQLEARLAHARGEVTAAETKAAEERKAAAAIAGRVSDQTSPSAQLQAERVQTASLREEAATGQKTKALTFASPVAASSTRTYVS